MEPFFQWVVDSIALWGYVAIALGMALENACIPIPSELIFGFAGYLVYQGQLEFVPAVLAWMAGGLLGSGLAYGLGYWGGRPLIERYGRYFFLSMRHLNLAQRWFDSYGGKAAFFSRLLPVVRTFISLPAGFAKMPFGKFMLYTLLGSLPWTVGLIYAGMVLGEQWQNLNGLGHQASMVVAGALAVLALGYYYRSRRRAAAKQEKSLPTGGFFSKNAG